MTVIYYVNLCEEDIGEVQGMVSHDGKVLGTWCSNDGGWIGEYFNGFMKSLGIIVEKGSSIHEKAVIKKWRHGE